MRFLAVLLLLISLAHHTRADGPGDNLPDRARRIPKPGIEVPAETRQALKEKLSALNRQIEELRQRDDRTTEALLPDVQIYAKAVNDA
ncbi:MAG TPA: hypothetical protein VF306_00225, partial [Pirellulales bacterium]